MTSALTITRHGCSPRGGGIGELLIDAAARRRRLAIGVRHGGPLLEEAAGLLHDRGSLAEEHGIAREPEHKIHMPSMGNHLDDFWGREMTVAADQDMGRGPMAPEIGQEADQDHRILRARRTLPRSEEGGHQGVRGPFKNKQRQIAMTLVMMVIEGKFLLAMGRVLR